MAVYKCKVCAGALNIREDQTIAVCEYCGIQQALPKSNSDLILNLYDRANHFRRNNEYNKAENIYNQILTEDPTDAEAYWSLVLCKYGIEYVEDPKTFKRVPTVNKAQYTSIYDDENYKNAINYADGYQKNIFESEAKVINEIQKGIISISQKEEPYDIFISYKETDEQGRRTRDSVFANDLYNQLTKEGLKVFFSRITLESKLGIEYEPYIFAALNSAKVMVVIGTKPEYLNAVWVKNEWSRFLSIIKGSGGEKILIPAYKDMDPYDLPEEFSHLQAQDMNKLGFMQDLVRGINKILDNGKLESAKETTISSSPNNIAPLLKRGYIYLEEKNWQEADEYFERVLDLDPENTDAYLGKLLIDIGITNKDDLLELDEPFDDKQNYARIIRFDSNGLGRELRIIVETINKRNQLKQQKKAKEIEMNITLNYNEAAHLYEKGNYIESLSIFKEIRKFKDSEDYLNKIQALLIPGYLSSDGSYYFGKYPQTVVSDTSIIAELNKLTFTNNNGYYDYKGVEYAKLSANKNGLDSKFLNGETIVSGKTYYFKLEPIKWRILEETGGTYILLACMIIDQQLFYRLTSSRTINGKTIYANNYEHSTIRAWLNYDFYNKAFTEINKSRILETLVNNSASTTNSFFNRYASKNTNDKVYLLSYNDITTSFYGIDTNSARQAIATDYARAKSVYVSGNYSYWWLRSSNKTKSDYAFGVTYNGSLYSSIVDETDYGARPVIKINKS